MTPPAASSSNAPQSDVVTPLHLSVPHEEREETDREMRAEYLRGIRLAIDVLNARLLGLIAVLGGVGIWTWAVADPRMWTFVVGCGFSVGVVWPTVWLFSRKG